jgi:hypothetical protein
MRKLSSIPILLVLIGGCGGGGGNSGAGTGAVTPAASSDFSLSGSAVSAGVGKSGTTQIVVTETSGTSTDPVALVASAPAGIAAALSSASVAPGQSSTLTLAVDGTVTAPVSKSITITGARGSIQHTATVLLFVPIGGGKNNFIVRTQGNLAIPAAAVPYINKLVADVTGSGFLYDICGSASSTRTIEFVFDQSDARCFFSPGTNGANSTIHVPQFPDVSGGAPNLDLDHPMIHEMANSLANDKLAIQLASPFTVTEEIQTDPVSEACAIRVMTQMANIGKRQSYVNMGYEATLLLDGLLRFDPVTLSGIRTVAGYDSGFQEMGQGAQELLLGSQGFSSLAAFREAEFQAINAKGSLLSTTEEQALFNKAQIDETPAGDFFLTHDPLMLNTPMAAAGVKVLGWINLPQSPNSLILQAFNLDATGNASPIANGPVTIQVVDINGNQVLPTFTTDLANTSSPGNPFPIGLQNLLLPGVYVAVATATVGGRQFPVKFIVALSPASFVGTLSPSQPAGPSYAYIVLVDAQGNPAMGTLAVTEGTTVFSTTGMVIVQVGSSGQVTVNGKKFTVPPGKSRVVYAQ